MAGDDQLVIFVSSSMDELKPERKAVRSAIKESKGFEAFAWESDATAHAHSAQQEWSKQLARSDVTIVVLWKKLGKWTKDEIEISHRESIPILLFRKKDKDHTLEESESAYLGELEDPETGAAAKYFKSPAKLKKFVDEALWGLIKDRFARARERDLDEKTDAQGLRRTATTSDHGLIVEETAGPAIRRREPQDVGHLPRNRWTFVGRAAERGKLMRAIGTRDQLVAITGPPGIGKKALLEEVTYHEDFGPGFTDGVAIHPGPADRHNLEDLFQAIWEEFFETDDPSVVEPRKRRRQLADKEALFFLPDIEFSPNQIEQLLDGMPNAVFCVTGQSVPVPGMQVPVGGFTDPEEMLALFEDHYRAVVPPGARSDIAAVCTALGGNPSLIGLLAGRAWGEVEADPDDAGIHPLIEWAGSHREKAAEELHDWLVPPEEQRAVSVAQATEAPTPGPVMVDVAGSAGAVDDAHADGLLEEASPRYRAAAALTVDPDDELMGEIFESAQRWADEATANEIYADRAFVLRMMDWGADRALWEGVIRLGKATEAPMSLGGRHGAWEQVLEHSLVASRSMEPADEAAEGWALHQLGSRALLRDELGDARVLLHESLRRRPDHDEEGRAVTRRNLGLLPAAIVSGGVLLLWLVVFSSWAAAMLNPDAPLEPNLDVAFDPPPVPAPAQEPEFEFTEPIEAGEGKDTTFLVSIAEPKLDGDRVALGDSGFCIVVGESCVPDQRSSSGSPTGSGESGALRGSLVPGQPVAAAEASSTPCRIVVQETQVEATVPAAAACALKIGFQPRVPGRHEARIVLEATNDGSKFSGSLDGQSTPEPIPISEIDPDFAAFTLVGQSASFVVRNVGTAGFEIGGIAGLPDAFEVVSDTCSGASLDPDEPCEFRLEYVGGVFRGLVELELTPDVRGDRRILLVAASS